MRLLGRIAQWTNSAHDISGRERRRRVPGHENRVIQLIARHLGCCLADLAPLHEPVDGFAARSSAGTTGLPRSTATNTSGGPGVQVSRCYALLAQVLKANARLPIGTGREAFASWSVLR